MEFRKTIFYNDIKKELLKYPLYILTRDNGNQWFNNVFSGWMVDIQDEEIKDLHFELYEEKKKVGVTCTGFKKRKYPSTVEFEFIGAPMRGCKL